MISKCTLIEWIDSKILSGSEFDLLFELSTISCVPSSRLKAIESILFQALVTSGFNEYEKILFQFAKEKLNRFINEWKEVQTILVNFFNIKYVVLDLSGNEISNFYYTLTSDYELRSTESYGIMKMPKDLISLLNELSLESTDFAFNLDDPLSSILNFFNDQQKNF